MAPKRKRSQSPEQQPQFPTKPGTPSLENAALSAGEDNTDHQLVLDAEKFVAVQKKVHYAFTLSGRAFRKARDFEVKKIIRRVKLATY